MSYNVYVSTNPRGLKERSDWVRQDLASQGCLPESTSSKCLGQTKGAPATAALDTLL
ncbi:hypothetical protein [Paenibacillus roseipurpureus]|uniref:Uncharacterized protein n=1 Tax=Paenibacillus roseopurpureus TaxID=2918901 RepID=A0AA96RJA8_9BACL|nr:hypothetical protein [Paenibacillus sp. MBLB1832]WNR43670.1 hypothetical protein MJB10_21595 [Paenibacillus sp. MBLB1832]